MSTTIDMETVGAFAEQIAGVITGGVTTAMMVVGDRLGLYAALARSGPVTPAELADETGNDERYVREWLAQQAAIGFVDHDPTDRTFTLPAEHAAVLATDDSPASMIGAAQLATGMHRRIDEVVAAFRTGDGIAWADQDHTVFENTERFFRVSYRNSLLSEWIPAVSGLHEKLSAGAYVADVGCGRGAPLILMAEAYPASRFVGFDLHEPSIILARKRAAEAGVSDRVTFDVAHSQGYPLDRYDLITFFDAFHDLGDPLAAARYARSALDEHGTLMLVEPRAGDDLASTIATVPVAALSLAVSTFVCVPNSLSQPGHAALGAGAGERKLSEVLTQAGLTAVRRAAESPFNIVLEARP